MAIGVFTNTIIFYLFACNEEPGYSKRTIATEQYQYLSYGAMLGLSLKFKH
jgi:hypothetical protein